MHITGVVLAGGLSRRMGSNKADLLFHQQRLLDFMLDLLAKVGVTDRVVSGNFPGYTCVSDIEPQRGPVGALHSLAEALPKRRLLIVPVDMPALTPAMLSRLLQADTDAPCVHFVGAPLPLRLDTGNDVRAEVSRFARIENQSARSLRGLLEALGAQIIGLPAEIEPNALHSVNTPQDWLEFTRNRQRGITF